MANLNQYQQLCVNSEGHTLVIACPGSGKTTVLTFRAENLLSKYSDGNILTVTFTKDAAEELRGRMAKKLPHAKSRIGAGTFHSLAKKQLQRAGFTIDLISEQESKAVIANIMETFNCELEDDVVNAQFTELQSCLNPYKHTYLTTNPQMHKIWSEYQKIKNDAGKVDFSDFLLLAIKGMQEGSVLPYKARWILADEAQDMDEVQHEWIRLHSENGSDITLVCDDDQSVYSFRAAQGYEGIMNFKNIHDAKTLVLPINYRCGRLILEHAAKLIEHNNPHRVEKPIEAGVDYEGYVHETICPSPCTEKGSARSRFEYERMVSEIIATDFKHLKDDGHRDWAVLTRNNIQLNDIEQLLIENGIPYSRKSGSFWEQPVLRTYLSILKYVIENDWFGFSIFVNYFIGTNLVFDKRCNNLTSLYHLLKDDRQKEKLKPLLYFERQWQDMILEGTTEKEDELLRDVAYFLEKNLLVKNEKARERQINVLIAAINALINTKGKNLKNRIFIRTSPMMNKGDAAVKQREKALAENKLFVSLLTMHSSKGLEFDNVWLAGCETQNFLEPKKDGRMVDTKEERRLFYVAMTRAKYNLFSSLVLTDNVADSRFLLEAGILKGSQKEFGG